jgi:hypothetical protein
MATTAGRSRIRRIAELRNVLGRRRRPGYRRVDRADAGKG